MAKAIKNLHLEANSFTANGQKYIIHQAMTIKRFEIYERLQLEVAYGIEFENIATQLNAAYDDLQKFKAADASVKIHNILFGLSRKLGNRELNILLLCSLFVCRENEDLTAWTEAEASEKINDWRTEGIDIQDFFKLAFGSISGFTKALEADLLNTSATTA